MQIGRNGAVLQRQHGLHQPDRARCGLAVAEVGLGRPQRTRAGRPVNRSQTREFDRVADRCSGAMCLDQPDGGRVDRCGPQRGAVDGHLRVARRGGDVDGAPVLVDRGAADDRQNAIAVAFGIGQALEQEDRRGLTGHETVRRNVERMAPAGRRQHPLRGTGRQLAGLEHDADPAGERQVALAVMQAAARVVDGQQARGAGRVHRVSRAVRAQVVGDPARRQAEVVAGEAVRALDRVGIGGEKLVIPVGQPHENPGQRPRQGPGVDARVFDGFPCGLQEQTVLRVDRGGLALADTEESGVESGHVIEEGPPLRHRPPGHSGLGVVELLGVPALGRNLGDQVVTLKQRSPQLVRGFDSAREPAAHTDDGDRGGWCFGQVGLPFSMLN